MLPEHMRIKEYDQSVKLLDQLREELDKGNIMSILIVAETTGGELWSGCTKTQNVYMLAGGLMSWAMTRLGFENNTQYRERLDET